MKKIQINLLAMISCLLWASSFFSGKYCLQYIPPITLSGIRLFLSSLMVMGFVKKKDLKQLLNNWPIVLIYSFFKMSFNFITFNLGLARVSSSMGAMIIGSAPAITIILAVIFIANEHLTKRKVVSMLLGLIAIVMLSFRKSSDGSSQILGVVLLLSSVVSSSLTDIFIKRKTGIKFSVSLNFVSLLMGAVIVYSVGRVTEDFSLSVFSANYKLIGGMLFLAFISAFSTTVWLKLIQTPNVEVSEIFTWKLLIPSAGAIFSWAFYPDDNATLFSLFALSLILLSIFIATRRPKLKK